MAANSLQRFLIVRLSRVLLMLFAILTLIFVMFRVMPGDPTTILVVQGGFSPDVEQELLKELGLNRPIHEQYVVYLQNIAAGDMGYSFMYNEPVMDIIIPRLINSLFLMIPGLICVFFTAVLLGSYLGWNKGSNAERFGTFIPIVFRSIPHFVIGMFLLMIFSYQLGWFPASGMLPRAMIWEQMTWGEILMTREYYLHYILPFVTIFLFYLGDPLLLMRGNIINEKEKHYIKFHHYKGLTQQLVRRHATRNSLLPVVTWLTPMVGLAFGGQILIETVFGWPGIGRALVVAVNRQDYPLLQAAFLAIAVAVLVTNLIVDFLYAYLDPRISYGGE